MAPSRRKPQTDELTAAPTQQYPLATLNQSDTSLGSCSDSEEKVEVGRKEAARSERTRTRPQDGKSRSKRKTRSKSIELEARDQLDNENMKTISTMPSPPDDSVVKKVTGVDDIPLEDDSHMPTMTLRALLTGLFISSIAAVIQQFFLFKPSRTEVQPLFLQLACLLVGRSLQNIPGPTWWNPGPYSIKENALSAIMAAAASVGTLAVEMIATQELYEERPFHYATAMAIMLSSQLIGYGFAGLLRRPLVYSRRAIFPGMLSLSFDWNSIGALGPLYTPFAAQVNEWVGVLFAYLFYSVGWEKSWFNGGKSDGFSFLSSNLYTHTGEEYNKTAILKEDGTGNWEMIEKLGAPYFSTSYILSNIAINLAVGGAVSHCIFWGWKSVFSAFTRKGLSDEEVDRHQVVCRKYREVPLWAYLAIVFFSISVAFLTASLTDSGLSAAALVVALLLAALLTVATAYLKATTGASLEVRPVVQMLGGMTFPSDAFGNMWFTTYGSATVSQSISMLQDLKLGQYMHLPPVHVLIFQITGTVAGVIFNYIVMSSVVNTNRELLKSSYGNQVFTGVVLEDFQTQAISWGIFAHELFKAGARYVIVPASLGIGFLLPIPFYIGHRFLPKLRLDLVNTPLICGSFALVLDRANAGFTMSVIVGLLSQFYARRYRPRWFHRSNYVLSAALDGGAQVAAVILGFVVEGGAGWKRLKFPQHPLNPSIYPFHERAPDYCMLEFKPE